MRIIFFGYEETDLCFRAWKLGYEVVFLPVNIIHYEHGSYSNNDVKKERRLVYFLESRRLYFIHKNYNAKFLLKKLPFVYYYFLGSMVMDIVKRKNTNLCLGRLKALLWFFTKIPEIIRKRMIKKNYIRSENDLENLGLIISHKNR
ncbi:glycosyltransferase family 2 protein [Acidianus brierleyi]|uniref:glycosyltransferase family 2 protein n=1 Tax=Acidianus brierleyi TaxID=41673 RepID=UPI001FECD3FB|nr:hypothetical protein [Acidianus brierleyi]